MYYYSDTIMNNIVQEIYTVVAINLKYKSNAY